MPISRFSSSEARIPCSREKDALRLALRARKRLARTLRALTLAAAASAAVGSTGCAELVGDQEIETKFRVKPKSDGSFFGWSEITVDADPSDVDGAKVGWVTLRVTDPPNADLRFIQTVRGEAVVAEEHTPLVEKSNFPPEEPEVPLDVVYRDDIRGFFETTPEDEQKIRIEWRGTIEPTFTNWPEDGFAIRVTALIEID